MSRISIRSPHPTHKGLFKKDEQIVPKGLQFVVRFGSKTALDKIYKNLQILEDKNDYKIISFLSRKKNKKVTSKLFEINKPEAISNSASKILMKEKFSKIENFSMPIYCILPNTINELKKWMQNNEINYPIIVKKDNGSRNRSNYFIKDEKELEKLYEELNNFNRYIVEKYYNFNKEYRLHISKYGCFYTCRKMLKSDIPPDKRWFRNDSNCVWVLEENPLFDKPSNWDEIVKQCQKALIALDLDLAAFDIRVQSSKDEDGRIRKNSKFIIIESNSAPSFGDITKQKYKQEIIKLINEKI